VSDQHDEITTFLSEWTAAEVSGDVAALERQLDEDFAGIGPLGFMLSRKDWLERHATGALSYDRFVLGEVQPRVYGDAAVVTARQTGQGTYQGHPVPGELRVTLVLAQRSRAWRLVVIHMSFIAGTPGAPPVPGRS
jgi:ketosteroid isomerase-like protein